MLAASKYGSQDFPGGLVVKIHASTAGGACSIPGLGTKITHVTWKKKEKILNRVRRKLQCINLKH